MIFSSRAILKHTKGNIWPAGLTCLLIPGLEIYLSIYLSVYLSIIYLSISLSIYHLSITEDL